MRKFRYSPLALVILAFCATPAAAAPTDLDPTFGVGGKADFGNIATDNGDIPMTVTPDGKILIAYDAPGAQGVVRRINADGTTDTTFGASGAQVLPVEAGATNVRLTDIAYNPNGRIWVGGSQTFAGEDNASVWALTPGGSPDTGYSVNGVDSWAPGTSSSEVVGIAIEGDNLVVAARAVSGTVGVSLIRVFAAGGSLETLQTFPTDFQPNDVALRPDGSVMVAGEYHSGSASFMSLPRFSAAGFTHDASFGLAGLGIIGPPVAATSTASAVVVDPNNNTFAFGMYAYTAALGGLTVVGAPIDDSAGVSRIQHGGFASSIFDGSRTPSGSFFGVGMALEAGAELPTVYRFKPDIAADPGFGSGGQFALTPNGTPDALSQAVQPDGRYLVTILNEDGGVQIQRLLGDYTPPPPPPAPTAPTVKFGSSVKSKSKAAKFKKISGTAAGTAITRVEIAIQKVDKRLLKKSKRCLFVKSSRGALTRVKSVRGKCSKPKWLRAKGTTRWSFRLSRKLKPGSYVLRVRAIGAGGVSKTVTKRVRLSK